MEPCGTKHPARSMPRTPETELAENPSLLSVGKNVFLKVLSRLIKVTPPFKYKEAEIRMAQGHHVSSCHVIESYALTDRYCTPGCPLLCLRGLKPTSLRSLKPSFGSPLPLASSHKKIEEKY